MGDGKTSPFGNGGGGGGKSGNTTESRPQKMGDGGCNPQSVPPGGKYPVPTPGKDAQAERKPFKLNGGG